MCKTASEGLMVVISMLMMMVMLMMMMVMLMMMMMMMIMMMMMTDSVTAPAVASLKRDMRQHISQPSRPLFTETTSRHHTAVKLPICGAGESSRCVMMNHLWVHMHLFHPPHTAGLYHRRVGGKHTQCKIIGLFACPGNCAAFCDMSLSGRQTPCYCLNFLILSSGRFVIADATNSPQGYSRAKGNLSSTQT